MLAAESITRYEHTKHIYRDTASRWRYQFAGLRHWLSLVDRHLRLAASMAVYHFSRGLLRPHVAVSR